jgi:hypothetical protein
MSVPLPISILQIFQNNQIVHQLRNEIVNKFKQYHIRGFQIIPYPKYSFLRDTLPLAFVIQVPFHPQQDFTHRLPKEEIFECFKGTALENHPIFIKGEVVG